MKYIIVRDDDICFFTRPEMLETVYQPLLKAGVPIGLAVVPAIAGGQSTGSLNGPFWDLYRLDYSPCLPPQVREKKATYQLNPDCEIVSYIKSISNYEILQHGYNHISVDGVREGMFTDPRLILAKIKQSRDVMISCFGRPSDFFVVPWDDISKESLSVLRQHFKGISLHRVGKRHVSWPRKPEAVLRKFIPDKRRTPYMRDGHFLLLEYPGPILSMFHDCSKMKEKVKAYLDCHDMLVLVNHYWEYFWDWDKPNHELLETWHEIASYLLSRPDVRFARFSEIYDHIYS